MIKKVIAASAATGGLLLASAGTTVADTGAQGAAVGSPGILSGNLLQLPIHIPTNVCGNTIDIVGLLNPAFGNKCANIEASSHARHHHKAPKQHMQQGGQDKPASHSHRSSSVHQIATQEAGHRALHEAAAPARPELAHTGSEKVSLAVPAAASAGLLLGGVLLYRRGRRAAARG